MKVEIELNYYEIYMIFLLAKAGQDKLLLLSLTLLYCYKYI